MSEEQRMSYETFEKVLELLPDPDYAQITYTETISPLVTTINGLEVVSAGNQDYFIKNPTNENLLNIYRENNPKILLESAGWEAGRVNIDFSQERVDLAYFLDEGTPPLVTQIENIIAPKHVAKHVTIEMEL
ncbi:MAG: hypothetical protein GY861_23385 [bacterium]|nr:hypothetical protein [bacterium]